MIKINFLTTILCLAVTLAFSQTSSALEYTPEQCQIKREGLDNYILIVRESIRSQFESNSRYRFANQRRLEKLIWSKELAFYNDCPNYVY